MDNYNRPDQSIFNDRMRENLPNATAVLVLGIISIVGCFCYGIVGLICGIISLVLASKDSSLYKADPMRFMPSSYNNLKAGRVCAIIGVTLSVIYLIIIVGFIAYFGMDAMRNGEFYHRLQQ